MSDLKTQEQLRDDIASVLELSRLSWRMDKEANHVVERNIDSPFPRSIVFKALNFHPVLSAVAIASVWYLGPARFSAMAVAGASLFMRHRLTIMPIATQLASAGLFKPAQKKQ